MRNFVFVQCCAILNKNGIKREKLVQNDLITKNIYY